MKLSPNRKLIIPILLLLIAGVQAWISMSDYGLRWLKAAWRTRHLTSEQRSARFLIGDEGYQFVDFLKASIPEASAIVKPDGVGAFSQQSNMQFLFIPRSIPICPCGSISTQSQFNACQLCLNQPGHNVLAITEYPPAGSIESSKPFIEFPLESDTLHGYYSAEDVRGAASPPSASDLDPNPNEDLLKYILELGLSAVLLMLGFWINRLILDGQNDFLSILAGLPVGMGVTTFVLFLSGWLGMPINSLGIIAVFAGMILILLLGLRLRGLPAWPDLAALNPVKLIPKNRLSRILFLLATLLIVALIGSSLIVSLGRSYSTYDGIANWALKGYAIAEFDTIFAGQNWGGHRLAYPQNVHLATSLFRTLTGDVLPGSKLLHPAFFAVVVLAVCSIVYRNSKDILLALSAGAVGASLPFVFYHSTLGFANVIFSGYVLLAALTLFYSLEQNHPRVQVFSGLLLGLVAWTRPEGIYFALALSLALLIHKNWGKVDWAANVRVLLPFAFFAIIWQSFGTRYQASDEIGRVLSGFVGRLGDGTLFMNAFQQLGSFTLAHATDASLWGFVWVLVLLGVALALSLRPVRTSDRLQRLGLAAAISWLVPLSMFLVSGLARPGFPLFLKVSFDRAMIPAFVLCLTAAICAFNTAQNQANDRDRILPTK